MARKTITADEIRQTVKDENVLFLRLMFTDINGIVKNVEVPISQLEKVLKWLDRWFCSGCQTFPYF